MAQLAIVARLKAVYKKLGDLADDIVADEIEADRQRFKTIDAELEACSNPPQILQDPEKVVDRVMQQLDNLLDQKDQMPLPTSCRWAARSLECPTPMTITGTTASRT